MGSLFVLIVFDSTDTFSTVTSSCNQCNIAEQPVKQTAPHLIKQIISRIPKPSAFFTTDRGI